MSPASLDDIRQIISQTVRFVNSGGVGELPEVQFLYQAKHDHGVPAAVRDEIGELLSRYEGLDMGAEATPPGLEAGEPTPAGTPVPAPKAPPKIYEGEDNFENAVEDLQSGDRILFEHGESEVWAEVNKVTAKTVLVEVEDEPDIRVYKSSIKAVQLFDSET